MEAREAATGSVSEMQLGLMGMAERAAERRLGQLASKLDAEIEAAVELRDERLRVAQEAERHYLETWSERRGDVRFARPGFGIGVGNAAVEAIQRAQREANRTARLYEEADATAEKVAADAEAKYQARIAEEHSGLLASFSPEQRALFAALAAEDVARQKLIDAAPEAWSAYDAQRTRSDEQARDSEELWSLILRLGLIVGLALIPARVAQEKGRSFLLWWLFGLLPMLLLVELWALVTAWRNVTFGANTGVSTNMGIGMGLALIPAWTARKKGRSFLLWWLYGMAPALFIVALIHSLIMSRGD